MARRRVLLPAVGLALLAVALAGCGQASRRVPEPELLESYALESPLIGQPATTVPSAGNEHRVFLPLVFPVVNKLGMAGCPPSCETFGCSWCYSWSLWPSVAAGREAVPMLWDETGLMGKVGGNSAWLMGWNEPDLCPAQACISPAEGAILWRIVELRNPGRKLLAPAPSHLHLEWLSEWRAKYIETWGRAPRIDGLAAHCYLQSAAECIALVERFKGWAAAWGVGEIWVTEFAFLPAYCDAQAEAQKFVRYLEAEPLVTRYAPYVSYGGDPADPAQCPSPYWSDCRPEADPSLLEKDLQTLTPLGKVYAKPPDWVWWGQGW